jgi:hypothetical protein
MKSLLISTPFQNPELKLSGHAILKGITIVVCMTMVKMKKAHTNLNLEFGWIR